MALDFENWLKIDENIPTTLNSTEEDISLAFLQTNEPGETENEEIELDRQKRIMKNLVQVLLK